MHQIKNITINNVKAVRGMSLEINKPAVLISGDHRSGKSAISQAIQFAVFGESDDVGKRGAGALINNSVSSAHVEVVTDEVQFLASVSTNAKGTVSQKRSASPVGSPNSLLSDDAVREILGPVPVTIQGLLALTGEELWQLAMPNSSNNTLPDYIVGLVADVVAKVKKLEFTSLSSLKPTAESIAAEPTEFVGKLTDLKKEVQERVKRLQEKAKASADLKPYAGRPVAELKQDLEAIASVISDLTKSLADRTRNSELAELKEKEIVKVAAAKTAEEKMLSSYRESTNTIERLIEKATFFKSRCTDSYIVKKDGENWDITAQTVFQPRIGEIIQNHIDQFPESHFASSVQQMLSEVGDVVQEMFYKPGEDPLLDAMIDEVMRYADGKLDVRTLLNDAEFESWCEKMRKSITANESAIVQTAALVESQKIKLKDLTKQRDEARRLSEVKIDSSRMETLNNEKKALEQQIDEANKTIDAMSSSVASRAAIGEVQALVPQVDLAISQIQDYRRTILEGGLSAVEKLANQIVEECGLPKLVLTAGTGKRPTLLISNACGVQMSVMCGLEKLIAGAAVIRALQRVRNVALPLLFLEGGEVNQLMTMVLLKALANFNAGMGGHVFMCHWVGLEEFETLENVQVIYA